MRRKKKLILTKLFNCNAYIINKCKGKGKKKIEKIQIVLLPIFNSSSMAETKKQKTKQQPASKDYTFGVRPQL